MEPISLVMPTFNEAETIGAVILEIPAVYWRNIIIPDGGNADGAQAITRAAGARVIHPEEATFRPANAAPKSPWHRRTDRPRGSQRIGY
jgi:hypothetical protein